MSNTLPNKIVIQQKFPKNFHKISIFQVSNTLPTKIVIKQKLDLQHDRHDIIYFRKKQHQEKCFRWAILPNKIVIQQKVLEFSQEFSILQVSNALPNKIVIQQKLSKNFHKSFLKLCVVGRKEKGKERKKYKRKNMSDCISSMLFDMQ